MYKNYGKYVFDMFVAVIILLVSLPLFILVIILIKASLGSPILFKQPRPGLNGKQFKIFKFRTMTSETDLNGNLLPDDRRMTKMGMFLRRFSLDELPELFNVIKGEMSLVGPRPLLMEYLPLYSNEQKRRHDVKPGITGWAQVNGRNALSWVEKFELDVWYVDNISFLLDMKILVKTLIKVFKSESITSLGHVSAPKFEGNKNRAI